MGFWRKPGKVALRILFFIMITGIVAVTSLRWFNPVTSSVILQRNLSDKNSSSLWISLDWKRWQQISPQMAIAAIAAEDQRFLQHHGLDFIELSNALREGANRPRGASTITQQVAKNMFLWNGRSYLRKSLEAVLAIYIDLVWGKQRVLEIYLNIAQFGPDIYGVENAAQQFFDKRAFQLNRHEAARLAAVLPNPEMRSAAHASTYVVQRQQWILQQMQALGGAKLIGTL